MEREEGNKGRKHERLRQNTGAENTDHDNPSEYQIQTPSHTRYSAILSLYPARYLRNMLEAAGPAGLEYV